ncbi:MAG: hypothetical protein AAGF01_12690 [Cyanobacteria bacterium P01_G01_bin.38]
MTELLPKLRPIAFAMGLAALGSGVFAFPTLAVDFDFSFTNFIEDEFGVESGIVTGRVRGLTDNATGPATSVEVLSHTFGFGVGEYVGSPSRNTWTLQSGMITSYSFLSFGSENTLGVMDSSLNLQYYEESDPFAGLTDDAFGVVSSPTDLTFTRIVDDSSGEPPATVPEPFTTSSIIAFTLGGMGFGTWRKHRLEQNTNA